MSHVAPRILVADRAPSTRTRLELVLRDQGWDSVTVDSSFQVLRTVRDADVDLVLIDPDLPGAGVSGVDVVKTLKNALQFRRLPVLFLLHGDRAAPEGVPAEGVLAIDRLGPEELALAMKRILSGGTAGGVEAATGAAAPGASHAGETPAEMLDRLRHDATRLTTEIERLLGAAQDAVQSAEAAVRRCSEAELGRIVESVAREVVPSVAERLIVEEVERARRTRAELVQAAEAEARRCAEAEVERMVASIVGELARETVPAVAERLIRDEIERLRREYGLADEPRKGSQ